VYYSSADRTTVTPPAARPQTDGYGYETARVQTQTTQTEDANPDYQGGTQASGTGTDYYDDSYTSNSPSGFGQPYTGPGVSTYNYTPSWSVSPSFYGSPFGYGAGLSLGYGLGGFGGYSPYGYGFGYPGYAGFYDPFYSPYGYGSAFSLGFGYGLGGFGYPYGFGSPFGFGYSPYYAYGRYPYSGGGYYGGGGYYEGGYGGARNYVYKNAIVNGGYPNGYDRNAIRVGRRDSRAMNAVGAPGAINPGSGGGGNIPPSGVIGGRRVAGGAAAGFGQATGVAPGQVTGVDPTAVTGNQPNTGGRRFDQTTVNPNSPTTGGRGAWRSMDNGGGANGSYNQPRGDAAANPGGAQPRRGGFFRDVFSAPATGGGNNGGSNMGGARSGFGQPQQQQQRAYSQPDRNFSQPRMEQRSFQPAPTPSFGGGGGGGGAAGGFGGGGGGGRRGR